MAAAPLAGRAAALCLPGGSVQRGPAERGPAGAAKLLEMPAVLRDGGQGTLGSAGLQSSRTEAQAVGEGKEGLNQVCV